MAAFSAEGLAATFGDAPELLPVPPNTPINPPVVERVNPLNWFV